MKYAIWIYTKGISLPKFFVVAEFYYLILFESPYDTEDRKSGLFQLLNSHEILSFRKFCLLKFKQLLFQT